ncbi:UvrD-helicase domain-containing protein [Bacillus sp. 03113]|uniref:UvrD-helicase domain-containing protein n=1 Tax=Bacillus sp. 03113 TaxID=2578211 RepID=UPI001142D40D|nr:ATP-dependent helicase [Bacillus sp. 03113]
MKTAIYHNKIIHIDLMNRDSFQKMYDEGKKGALMCPSCGEKVRFHLGIETEPYFYHLASKEHQCQDLHTNVTEPESLEYTERNGFRLPKTRSITTATEKMSFRKAQAIKSFSSFSSNKIKIHSFPFDYLNKLSEAQIYLDNGQAKAVSETEGPLLVVAGAGSGKTRVLTARTAFMLSEQLIDPKSIMLVTFTAKAALEMKSRLVQYPDLTQAKVKQLVSGTFHSLFYRILSFHYPQKWVGEKLLKKEWQREYILKDAGKELQLDDKEFAYDAALQQIGYWKNSLQFHHKIKPASEWEEKALFLYKRYEEFKLKEELFDFDDMLIGCYELFLNQPEILTLYQNRLKYFLIDEFQDVNRVQYEIIKLLSSQTRNVCAVGDDDQSIYAFRGSDPKYLQEFEKDFPGAKIVILDQNYRSSHQIVSAANQIIVANKQRRSKSMNAQFETNHPPILFYPYNEEEEATMIVTDIEEKISNGQEPSDFAILYRTNTASRAVFERLAGSSLPFIIEQDSESFYNRFMIKSMLAYFKLSLNEDDQSALKDLLPSLFVKKGILQDIKANSILQDCTLLESLSKIETGFPFQERKLKKIVPITRSLSSLSPIQAIEIVEKELGFQEFMKKRGNEGNKWERGSDDIKDLKVVAKQFATISMLLDHADHMIGMNNEMKKQRGSIRNGITLSTIHRAKGLEYKHVYIIGAVDGSIPHDYALESYRNGDPLPMEEERRLLYVGATRAKEQLFLSILQERRGKKAAPSRFLLKINKGE